jgi:protease PrsW
MGLLALALAPGIFICLFIYFKDRYKREPISLLLWAFVLGMLSTLPAVAMQMAYNNLSLPESGTMAAVAFFAFCVVGFSEEISKFLMLRLFLFSRKAFDDPFDGIVYAVMVGMGFATLENVLYVMQHGLATGIMRMFLSVPAHGTFAVLMGYFTGLAKFNPAKRPQYFLLAILLPVLFHGAFDFFLFIRGNGLQVVGALVSFVVAIYLSRRAIKHKQHLAKLHAEENGYQ